jgi:hypothetical protein
MEVSGAPPRVSAARFTRVALSASISFLFAEKR